jgi:NADPH-dependent 2,4-dienoyl-CoA reductase/sulfur reductase-like enzyme
MSHLSGFGVGLVEQPAKLWQAIQLRRELGRTPYLTGCWVTSAEKQEGSLAITLRQGRLTWQVECDYLACAFHLVPNPELAVMLGCSVEDGHVRVNEYQETSQPAIYCAGESTGIGGVELALVEGQIAGYAAAEKSEAARDLFGSRSRLRRFANRLNQTFSPRNELKTLPTADTIVCRCEDVQLGRIQQHRSWREAKLHTRCGMGPCQGRICGAALKFLLNWEVESIRPPVFPVRVESLAGTIVDFQSQKGIKA